MPILFADNGLTGQTGLSPKFRFILTNDTNATVTTAGYLTQYQPTYQFQEDQLALVYTTDDKASLYSIVISGSEVSLVAEKTPGEVITPTVANDFAAFNDVNGTLKDSGKSASDNTKTKVVMATGAVTANHIAVYTDTAGTIGQDATVAVNHGAIQSGSATGGSSGSFNVYPTTSAAGGVRLTAIDNTAGDFEAVIQNIATMGQNTTYILSDPEQANCSILVTRLSAADSNSNLWSFDVTATAAELASGGAVGITDLILGSARYKIRALWLNSGGTNFSGGGDRSIEVADAATTYTVIADTVIQSLVNAGWGSTEVPYPASAPINETITSSLFIRYTGGTTDYPTGSLTISGILERVV